MQKKYFTKEDKQKAKSIADRKYREKNKEKLKKKKKEYREKNKEKISENKKKLYKDNPEKSKIYQKKYYIKNTDKVKNRGKLYYKNNKEKVLKNVKTWRKNNPNNIKKYRKKYTTSGKRSKNNKERLKTDPIYKLNYSVSRSISKALKGKMFTKTSRTHEILGCSFDMFKEHIEKQFEPWMNWENHGLYNGTLNYGWDLDHVIPLNPDETKRTEQEIIELNHYTNLRPFCSYINRVIKRNKLNF